MSNQCLPLTLNKIKNIRRSKGVGMKLSRDEQVALNAFNCLSESQKKNILEVMDYLISLRSSQPLYPSTRLTSPDLRR
jgi:hypothetical protein